MSTFFGEIGALLSRADDDEETDSKPMYTLSVSKEGRSVKKECKLGIFTVGELASTFAQSYLIPDNAHCLFNINYLPNPKLNDYITFAFGTKSKLNVSKAASAFFINKDVIVCDISSHVPEMLMIDLCEKILKKIKCEEVLVLTSNPASSFKSEDSQSQEKNFLKSLATSQYTSSRTCTIPRLEAPNFLSHFSAAVMAEFEVKKKPALCIINYVESCLYDSADVQAFERVFSENLPVKLVPLNDATSNLAKRMKIKISRETNLYT
ncbi:proteasome assembly chaperone 1 [Caerostris extrusa]|uniref:Proteasome assembly chaperone 1 n=1 Tax=Caerostris extrusa TaxID=172846 RepID=A0AAV4VNJ3_CAEEX|nr:proteasome assembly chaperone 1 [Caerostris extrusa]